MTEPDPLEDALVDRYVAGECSQDEAEQVGRWMSGNPVRMARVTRARAVFEAARNVSSVWDVDRAWERTRMAIQAAATTEQHQGQAFAARESNGSKARVRAEFPIGRTSRLIQRDRIPLLAAAACLAVGAVALAWWETARRAPLSAPESIVTGPRQQVSVQLRDGSRVVLAPESRLVEPAEFGVTTREVQLDGAAYFDVVHDASRPFVVITHDLRIRDLGTRFAVDAYASQASTTDAVPANTPIRVAVTAGSVEMEAAWASQPPATAPDARTGATIGTVVRAGHVGRIDVHGHITVDRPADINQYVSWTTNDLEFDNVPLSEAMPRLERWYGVRVILGNPALACRHITATFRDESLDQVLDELSLALHVRHVRSAGSVTLESGDAEPSPRGSRGQVTDSATECTGRGQRVQ